MTTTLKKFMVAVLILVFLAGMSVSAMAADDIRIGFFINGHDFVTNEDPEGNNQVYTLYQGKRPVDARLVIDKTGVRLERRILGKTSWYVQEGKVEIGGEKYAVLTDESKWNLVLLDRDGYVFLELQDYSCDWSIDKDTGKLLYLNRYAEKISVNLSTFEVELLDGCDCFAESYTRVGDGTHHYGVFQDTPQR